MKLKNFYFRSFQVAVLVFILIVMAGCSLYPTIEPHNQASASSTLFTHLVMSEKSLESPDSDGSVDEQLTIGLSPPSIITGNADWDSKQLHFSEMDGIQPIKDVLDQVDGEPENEEQAPPKSSEGVQQSMKIAITFDDGPDLKFTPQILDILQEKEVHATFFVVGVQIKKYPEVLQRIEAEGHLIGNHSYYHPNFTKLSSEELSEEITATDDLIFGTLGHVPTIVRPPYGAINDEVKVQLEEMGKSVMLWNIDPRDWDGASVEEMRDNILSNAKDGGNILLHSFGSKHVVNTVMLLPIIIDELRAQGYEFVTVDELS